MAIGRPVTLTGNVAAKMINVLATAGQTSFTVEGGYRINQIAVYRNGVRLAQSRDFTANDGSTVTLLSAATVNDVIEYQIIDDFIVAGLDKRNNFGLSYIVFRNDGLRIRPTFSKPFNKIWREDKSSEHANVTRDS